MALGLLFEAASLCDEDVRLQRLVPHLLALLADPSATIRNMAVQYAIRLLQSVENVSTGLP